ncbi:sigma-E factor negative regulatory protein [Dokdonella soli]|uniref:Anti sigma-E protein RseA N-terminal domain-containing protein n=1 Tax=Dokdonella soli TaxID=529810 RepID=A0ABN1IDM3_9GAMM
MNQQIHEQLSALMDGELERDQTRFLLKRLTADSELPVRWTRYHVVRQTLRRQEVVALAPGFPGAVMARLELEPVVHASGTSAWLRWGAGGAIAASVAVAALMLTRPVMETGPVPTTLAAKGTLPQTGAISAATVAATTASGEFRPPLVAPNSPVEAAPASFGTDLVEPVVIDPRLQSYLIRHYQAAGAAGQSNFVPYVLLGTPQREGVAQPVPQNH